MAGPIPSDPGSDAAVAPSDAPNQRKDHVMTRETPSPSQIRRECKMRPAQKISWRSTPNVTRQGTPERELKDRCLANGTARWCFVETRGPFVDCRRNGQCIRIHKASASNDEQVAKQSSIPVSNFSRCNGEENKTRKDWYAKCTLPGLEHLEKVQPLLLLPCSCCLLPFLDLVVRWRGRSAHYRPHARLCFFVRPRGL